MSNPDAQQPNTLNVGSRALLRVAAAVVVALLREAAAVVVALLREGAAVDAAAAAVAAAGGGPISRLNKNIMLLGHLDSGLGFYRFTYRGGTTRYVGVMAQEVRAVMPEAVVRGPDGYLRVHYDRLGVKFRTYDQWLTREVLVPPSAASQPILHDGN